MLHETGKGVTQNSTIACGWYEQAAEQGHVNAQFNAGVMYEKGRGVEIDLKKAFELYKFAVKKGNAPAQCNLGTMYYYGHGVTKNLKKSRSFSRKLKFVHIELCVLPSGGGGQKLRNEI